MPPKKRQYGDLENESSPFNSPSSSIRINDLTASPTQQYQRAPKQPRTASNTHLAQTATGSSQLDALVIDSDDDDDASQEEPDSTQGYNEQQYNYSLYGTLNNKIVGVRYYNGYATVGEMVVCRREPNNRYDSNAIQVLNVQGEQIGHIPRTLASKLAKYMDNRSLMLEAVLTGNKGAFDCPLAIRLYGTNELSLIHI